LFLEHQKQNKQDYLLNKGGQPEFLAFYFRDLDFVSMTLIYELKDSVMKMYQSHQNEFLGQKFRKYNDV